MLRPRNRLAFMAELSKYSPAEPLVRPSGFFLSCALAAHSMESLGGLLELSNSYCLPGGTWEFTQCN